MEAIEGTKNTSTTECGHTFHHQCLYKWHRKHTNCPMCRKEFASTEEEQEEDTMTGQIGNYIMTHLLRTLQQPPPPLDLGFRRHLRDQVARVNEERPIEEYTGEIDERDIALVMRQVEGVTHETAEAYLRYYEGDIVETILYLTDHKDMPIPRFRRRDRPEPAEPYVSPLIFKRVVASMRENADPGYESA